MQLDAIRAARREDLPALLALYRQLNPEDPVPAPQIAEDAYAAMLAQPGLSVFIGMKGDLAVSTVTLLIMPNLTRSARPYALVENVVTLEQHRSKGYGQAVIRHAIAHAFQANCYKVMLLTGRQRAAVHRFYESCGFVQNKSGFQIRND